MVTTAFGYSFFGEHAFGQSSADSTITIDCPETVYQVAIWYIEGLTHRRVLIDIGEEFGDSGSGSVGQVSQSGNLVQVHLSKEVYIVAVYLFDTDEDLGYLKHLSDWTVDNVYAQINGAARNWDEGDIYAISEAFPEVILVDQTKTPDPFQATQSIPPDMSPSIAAQAGQGGISISVSTTDVEEI